MTSEMAEIAKNNKNLGFTIEKTKSGAKRSVIQIQKTIEFEFQKNLSKFISMLLTAIGIFLLFLVIELIQSAQGSEVSADPIDYFSGYLMMIDFLILIIAVAFGGGIIAEDFEKDTGNLLFPKIQKDRLLIGRIIARYIYAAMCVIFYYVLIGIATLIIYESLPLIVWESMGWALLYTFAVFSFMILFSSFMKRAASAMIVGMLIVLMVFQLLTMILMFTGVTIEPLFILTYYANIITSWFNMPSERFTEIGFGMGPPGMNDGPTFMSWATPSATGAIIGMIIYSGVCIAIAYLIYKRRQN
ncbi:ABC transporter permease [Candidatus Lokiarchaeum ossiferum]|uniref:ABC transporter permease n=1 Tax=Candidatus Lokiarchaeum ossiferum TaxID=2951803 RepID=UPI00352E9A36